MKYFALLTKLGENLLAQATALGTKLELTHMSVGDGGGSLPTPDTNQTKLIAEKRRAAINTLFIDEKNPNQIIAEQIIPEQDGGWWIREIGLFDKAGNLIAVANSPETYKPQLAEGSGRTQTIRIVLIVSHTESVTLKIDPSVVLATREYVDDSVKKSVDEHEKSRKHPDASTTAKGMVQLADVLSADNAKAVTPKLATEINQRALSAQTTANTAVDNAATAQTAANNANTNANGRVPNTRKVNNKPLNTDITLNAADVGAHSKEESNAELALKFDKTGGTVTGKITVKRNGDAINITPLTDGSASYIQLDEFSGKRAGYIGFGSSGASADTFAIRNDRADTHLQIVKDAALINGTRLLPVGESGIGGKAEQITNPLIDLPNKQSGFYLTAAGATGAPTAEYYNYWWISRGSTTYGTVIAVGRKGDIWTNSLSAGTWLGWVSSYTTLNTTNDANGFIRTGSATALTTGQVVQTSGTSDSYVMSQKAVSDRTFGLNQVWRDVTNERTKGTTYTNSRNKAIMISVAGNDSSPTITVNGTVVKKPFEKHDYGTAIVPSGATYVVSMSGSVLHWSELA
ncbi:phage tail protein [Providencia sp.]|uniref:phage tail protein n=1 Tax=Providencia sp. TaxID=589 RepID=UPI003F96852F